MAKAEPYKQDDHRDNLTNLVSASEHAAKWICNHWIRHTPIKAIDLTLVRARCQDDFETLDAVQQSISI